MSDPSNAQITNTLFPPPPEYYKQFTPENLERHDELSSKGGPSRPRSRSSSPQPTPADHTHDGRAELSPEAVSELERLDGALKKPRADWIREEGRWVTFGEMSTVSRPSPAPVPAHRLPPGSYIYDYLLTGRLKRTSRHHPR